VCVCVYVCVWGGGGGNPLLALCVKPNHEFRVATRQVDHFAELKLVCLRVVLQENGIISWLRHRVEPKNVVNLVVWTFNSVALEIPAVGRCQEQVKSVCVCVCAVGIKTIAIQVNSC
jgi:hypothetical protein